MEIFIVVLLVLSLLLNVAMLWILIGISGFLMRMAAALQPPEPEPEITPQQQNSIDLMQ